MQLRTGPVGAWPDPWGRGRTRGGVAGPVGAWPDPWGRGRTRGGVAGTVGACDLSHLCHSLMEVKYSEL